MIEYSFIVCLVALYIELRSVDNYIIVDANLIEHGFEVFDYFGRRLKPLDELCDEVFGLLVDLLLVIGALEFPSFNLLFAADQKDVVNRVDDLADFLLVFVVSVDLVFEVLLEG